MSALPGVRSLVQVAKKLAFAGTGLSASLVIILALAYYLVPRPELINYTPYSSAYFDREGKLLRLGLANDDRYRLYQPLSAIATTMIEATVLYEDQNYYSHSGVDIGALIRAAWQTYVVRDRRIGASTISMQVARLRWGISSNNVFGKLHQIARAVQLSKHYSKDEILEFYLNLAPYGANIEGVAAASLIYFNKRPSQLSLPEALTLAVVPQNPNKRNPARSNSFDLFSARKRLFNRWIQEYPEDSVKIGQIELPLTVRPPNELPFLAPHFVDYVGSKRSRWDSGVVTTSLNLLTQKKLERGLKHYIQTKQSVGINNASALLLNYQTMSIEAMVGSVDFFDKSVQGQVNGATAKRSPGSTLKPFVYGLAMDEGLIHPMSLLKDSPQRFGGFTPENYDKRFLGPISAKDALIESRNVPAVDLQSRLTGRSFYQFLQQAGIGELKQESHYGLALALGGGEVTMLELASLYAALANQGVMKPIKAVDLSDDINPESSRILSKESSYLVLDMLKENPPPEVLALRGSGARSNEVAWKTGTSWAFRDAWAVGVSGPYVLVVWVGNFDGEGNEAFVGRTAAGPLLFSLFDSVQDRQGWQVSDLVTIEHLNLKQVDVCDKTGDLYQKHCGSAVVSWFIPGVSPIKVSNIYRSIPINMQTGLRACFRQPGVTEMKIYEFWPSDFLHIFNQAGISLNTPPAYEANCNLVDKSNSGRKPVITSPQRTIEYVVRLASKNARQIPLKAIVDSDVTNVHWFIDQAYIGSTKNGTTLLWDSRPGHFQVLAVDDSGRSTSKQIRVTQAN